MESFKNSKINPLALGAALVLLLLVGVAVWTILQSNGDNNTDKDMTIQRIDFPVDEAAQRAATEAWLEFMSPDKAYSVKIPDGWKLALNDQDNSLVCWSADDCLSYAEGEQGSVEEGTFLSDDDYVFYLASTKKDDGTIEKSFFGDFVEKGDFKAGNVTGTAYTKIVSNSEEDNPLPDEIQYGYAFTKGNRSIFVTYVAIDGEPNAAGVIEGMVRTLNIN